MAQFYYNSNSSEDRLSQWKKHLQNQSYFEDVTKSMVSSNEKQTKDFSSIFSQQTKEINNSIQNASREQVDAIQQSTNTVCGTLESGFEMLSDNLHEISFELGGLRNELNDMASMLDWNFSLLIEGQRISNLLSGNIAVLLRIPDIEKERQNHIEQGIKFLRNAIFDSDFYVDSLNNLLKAENIEPTDYFALHRIGLIYLYSPKHLDLNKAEEYFKKAAKYAVAETYTGASISTNHLRGNLDIELAQQKVTVDSIKLQAAESYLFASRSCYLQGKISEAAVYAGKSFSILPEMVEAGFMQAKALAANNQEDEAVTVLEKVISTDRFYSLKTLSDLDLCPKSSIQILLKKLQKEATEKASSTLNYCKQQQTGGSKATSYLDMIEELVNKKNYLTSKKAIDLLEKVKAWKFCEPFENALQTNHCKELIELCNSFDELKFMKRGNDPVIPVNDTFVKQYYDWVNYNGQWTFYKHDGRIDTLNWKSNIETNGGNFNVIQFIEREKELNDNLPSQIESLKNRLQGFSNDNTQHLNHLDNEKRKESIKANKKNLGLSVINGIGGFFRGLFWGAVVTFGLLLIFAIIMAILSGDRWSPNMKPMTFILLIMGAGSIIGSVIGCIIGFKSTRKK